MDIIPPISYLRENPFSRSNPAALEQLLILDDVFRQERHRESIKKVAAGMQLM
jgi:hypothetical protein